MELIEIIQSSITYFAGCTVLLMFLSYLIYKLKDRTRLKPYQVINEKKIDDKKSINVNFAPKNKIKNYTYTSTSNEKFEDYSGSYKVVNREKKEKKNTARFTVVTFM